MIEPAEFFNLPMRLSDSTVRVYQLQHCVFYYVHGPAAGLSTQWHPFPRLAFEPVSVNILGSSSTENIDV